jgi:hypothetical protein
MHTAPRSLPRMAIRCKGVLSRMSRFVRLVRRLCAIQVLLVTAVVLFGQRQKVPDPLGAVGISHCGDSFCYHGVVLGATTWDDAQNILRGHIESVGQIGIDVYFETPAYLIVGGRSASNFDELHTLSEEQVNSTLGNLISLYGPPCRVTLVSNDVTGYNLTLIYPFFSVSAGVLTYDYDDPQKNSLTFDSPTYGFSLVNPPDPCRLKVTNAKGLANWDIPWLGFTSANRYLRYVYEAPEISR